MKVFIFRIGNKEASITFRVKGETIQEAIIFLKNDLAELKAKHGALVVRANHERYDGITIDIDENKINSYSLIGQHPVKQQEED